MFGDLLELLWVPFLMCLVLTGIHAYLGDHVLSREVVFVDIALAQIAALGATAAFRVCFGRHAPRRAGARADAQPAASAKTCKSDRTQEMISRLAHRIAIHA